MTIPLQTDRNVVWFSGRSLSSGSELDSGSDGLNMYGFTSPIKLVDGLNSVCVSRIEINWNWGGKINSRIVLTQMKLLNELSHSHSVNVSRLDLFPSSNL